MLDARCWEINLGLSFKVEFGKDQLVVDDKVTTEGTNLSEVIDSYCLKHLTDEPTHMLPNSLSCIDLIITDQPNLLIDFGVHPSLYPKSHHQIVFGTINLSVPRPPSYKRTVRKYDKAEIGMINSELRSINWSLMSLMLIKQSILSRIASCLLLLSIFPTERLLVATGTHPGSQTKLRKLH